MRESGEEQMSNTKYTPGRVVWRELMTSDIDITKKFYGELLGWTFEDVPMGPLGTYRLVKANGKQIAGMAKMTGVPTHWVSYVSVPDVDAAANAWKAEGGKVAHGPDDIPSVGRFAMLIDPWGAVISAFKGTTDDPEPATPKKGEFCWETLTTREPEKAKKLYGKTFGWKMASGPGGPGSVFAVGDKPEDTIADLHSTEGMPPPSWLTYVAVENVEASRDRVAGLQGKILMPMIHIPKIGRISVIADPTGAVIGLFQAQMSA
jgi:predicted enzyme related to lactoylglutathione lyase